MSMYIEAKVNMRHPYIQVVSNPVLVHWINYFHGPDPAQTEERSQKTSPIWLSKMRYVFETCIKQVITFNL